MDIKGIAWVGNIYQKFETMCLEVEEAMIQETAKFVDTQVQTVGASMKRFCSDVMQDMRTPSLKDSSRLASTDLSLNPYLEFGIHKKPISSVAKEDVIDPVRVMGISDKKSKPSNDAWEDWSAASFNWEISDNDEANFDVQASNEATVCKLRGQREGDMCNVTEDTSFVSPPPGTIVSNKSSAMVGKRSRCISSTNIIRAERTEDTCESSGLVSQMGSQATSNTSNSQSVEEDLPHSDPCESSRGSSRSQTLSDISANNTQCGQPAGDDVLPSHTDSDPDLEEETENDTSVKIIESIGHESESGFEETCVLVDGNDYRPDNHKEEIRRSYKKKMQNAFSLKKKLSRKQEYKQLAAQYGKFDSELNILGDEAIKLALSHSENIKSKKLATNDSIESEWELL